MCIFNLVIFSIIIHYNSAVLNDYFDNYIYCVTDIMNNFKLK